MLDPFVILFVGVATVIGMILVLRLNAFLALIVASVLVSLLSPGETSMKITRVAEAFGDSVGSIGIVIALAAVIGKCLMDSGAADRIVRSFLRLLGERNAGAALLGSGFVLSVPVFLDTVFYLLAPLARSLWKCTRKDYLLYLLAIAAGTVITHTLIPPTPGPLLMASQLGIDLGTMIMVGMIIGLPTAVVSLFACHVMNRVMTVPMRPYFGQSESEPLDDSMLPSLWVSLLPVLLPVFLISTNTMVGAVLEVRTPATVSSGNVVEASIWARIYVFTQLVGNANMALLIAAAIAMLLLVRSRGLSLAQLARSTESALMSGSMIILITAAGGAFGAMLRQSGLQDSIMHLVGSKGGSSTGIAMLLLGFGIAVAMKLAQGSGTVSMITTSAMLSGMGISSEALGYNPVYLAMAIGGGSMVGSWMNDSGFWIYSRMGNLSETETLQSWTVMLSIVGFTILGFTILFSRLLPMV